MAEPERKCSTCKFYEPAPIWRKGWCRNPLLYAPQQSHLVAEDDLDCSRGLSDYWEAADGTGPNAGVNVAASGGSDLFGRGAAASAGGAAAGAADTNDSWAGGGAYGSGAGGYGGGYGTGGGGGASSGGYSAYGSGAIPTVPDDDDGYAPQETASSRPGAQPRYLGSVGSDETEDVRNPWNNAQAGYAAPPPYTGADDRGGYGYGQEAGGGYGAPPAEGDERGYAAPAGYGQGGYGEDNRSGYPQGGYPPDPAYGQGGYPQNGYEAGYGAAPAPGPTPASGGTRGPAPGNTAGGRRVVAPPAQGRERALTYYTEERYWTDYLKLAVPVVIVIALLGGIWFIGLNRIRGGSSATGTPSGTNVAGLTTPVGTGTRLAGTGPASAPSAVMNGTARSSLPPIVTAGTGTPGAGTAGAMGTPRTGPTLPATVMKKYKVVSEGGARMRAEPNVKPATAIVSVVANGTEVQETGDPPQTDDMGAIWYKVKAGDKTGWIRSDLLDAVMA